QAVVELRRRAWLRQAEGVLGGVRRADADCFARAARLTDAAAVRLAAAAAAVRLAEPGPEPGLAVSRSARSGAGAGAGDPSGDGLRRWEPTAGGWCAAGPRAPAAAPCA